MSGMVTDSRDEIYFVYTFEPDSEFAKVHTLKCKSWSNSNY